MKRFSLAAFALAMIVASVATAQPPGPDSREERGRERRGPGGGPSIVERMMAFDKDEDGQISKEEAPERLQSMFSRADSNEDGFLSREEVTAEIGGRQGAETDARPGPPEGRPGNRGGFREGMRPESGRGGFGGGAPRGPGGFGSPLAVIAALDVDGNGEISAQEIDLAVVSLRKLDRNKDGKLDRSEMGGAGPDGRGPGFGGVGMGGPGGGDVSSFMLQRFDADKDGKLTGDEIPERMRENLEGIDTNKDKSIDKSELKAMASRVQRGGRGGFGGGRQGDGGRPGREGDERARPEMEE